MKKVNFILEVHEWKKQIGGKSLNEKILLKKFLYAKWNIISKYKGRIRDLFQFFRASEKSGLYYGVLVEQIVNAMVDIKKDFINFEDM